MQNLEQTIHSTLQMETEDDKLCKWKKATNNSNILSINVQNALQNILSQHTSKNVKNENIKKHKIQSSRKCVIGDKRKKRNKKQKIIQEPKALNSGVAVTSKYQIDQNVLCWHEH